jgi:hypothetical protein
MKVAEMVKQLRELDQDSEIIVQVDYQKSGKFVSGAWTAGAIFSTDSDGVRRVDDLGLFDLNDHLRSEGYTDEDVIKNGVKVAVIHCFSSE